jgi:hypothetical protein
MLARREEDMRIRDKQGLKRPKLKVRTKKMERTEGD